MRIISGRFKGKRLAAPEDLSIRPTSDKAREALFSIIGSNIENALILDLFAGTGAFGIEALSRGARKAFFVDASEKAVDTVRKNIDLLGLHEKAVPVLGRIPEVLERPEFSGHSFDIIFLDPPYERDHITSTLDNSELLSFVADNTLVIAEHGRSREKFELSGHLEMIDRRKYGKTLISFFRKP